jgi:hypothetical protein
MATFTISQLTAKPSTYTMVDSDVFVMTTGTTTPLLSTVKANLADIRTFYEADGNEIRGSVWNTTHDNSASWDQAYLSVTTDVKDNSARWNTNANTELAAISARYTQTANNLETNVRPSTANWNNTYTDWESLSSDLLKGTTTSVSAWPTSSSVYRFAHGFAAKPGVVRGVAVCATAEYGYSVGDEIGLEFIFSEYDSGGAKRRDNPCCALVTSTVYVSAIFAMGTNDDGEAHGAHIIPNAGINGSPDETLTPAKWNVKLYAAHTPVA